MRTFVFLCIFFLNSALACHLGYIIISIETPQIDKYEVNCSRRALPICPQVCSWTNETCDEYATRHHWNKTHLVVTNMTYSYPLKASGYPRVDVGAGQKVKSLHRRCCLTVNIEAKKCKSFAWNADEAKAKFDILTHAESEMKCPSKNAYLRDIKQTSGVRRTFSLDICCLKYQTVPAERVACTAPPNGATQAGAELAAKIALGVSLPLALGVGIPLALGIGHPPSSSCAADKSIANVFCDKPSDYVEKVNGVAITEDQCCQLCVAKKYDVCNYSPGPYCELCNGVVTRLPSADEVAIVPRK